MTKKSSNKSKVIRRNWAYFLVAVGIIAIAFFGSRDKGIYSDGNMDMESIVSNNYQVSTDQVSQFYMVAMMANTMDLASAGLTETNYTTVSLLQKNSQTTDESGKISKPISVNPDVNSRGVISYTVQPGETMDTIAAKYGITTDQIRWSNNLGTKNLSVGQVILVPSVPGIAYKVKSGDTVESLAQKYGSSAEEIIAINDLEINQTLAPDSIILVPSGVLPETERPEYVAARSSSSSTTSSVGYQYAASYASGNRYAYGWCTWFAWQWRHDNMPGNYDLPSNLGNANTWAIAAASAGFAVNRTPSYGAVFQRGGGLGHVGIVTNVFPDGSIEITDMNGIAGWGRVGTTTIPASQVQQYSYIHGR